METGLIIVALLCVNFWGLLAWRGLEKIHQELPDHDGGNLEGQADEREDGELQQLAARD